MPAAVSKVSTKGKAIAAGLLLGSLAVVLSVLLSPSDPTSSGGPAAVLVPSTFPVPAPQTTSFGATQESTSTPVMLELFKRTRSASEFVEAAKRQPEAGGYLAAHYITRYCAARRQLLARVNAQLAQAEASATLRANLPLADTYCADLSEVKTQAQLALLRQGGQMGDRHASQLERALQDVRPDAGMKEAIQRKNPFEAVFADDWLWVGRKGGLDGVTAYFDGQWQDAQSSAALRFASMLVACEWGFPCSADRLEVQAQCRLTAECFADYRELVTYWAAQAGVGKADVQNALSVLMTRLNSGQVQAFVPE